MTRTIPNITPTSPIPKPGTTKIEIATARASAPTPTLDHFCHVFSSFLRKPSAILAIPPNKSAIAAIITKVVVNPFGNVMNKIAKAMQIIPSPTVARREDLLKNIPIMTLSIPRKSNAIPSKNTKVTVVSTGLKIIIIDKIIIKAPNPI